MSVHELFQPNTYDLFADTVTANTFNGIIVPAIVAATTFTVGPPGPLTVNGTTDLNGTAGFPVLDVDDLLNPSPITFSTAAYSNPASGNMVITDLSDFNNNAGSMLFLDAPGSLAIGGGTNFLTMRNPTIGNVFQVTSDGNINMNGSVNAGGNVVANGAQLYNTLELSNQGPPGTPFVNGALGYLADPTYTASDVLSILNWMQLQILPPTAIGTNTTNNVLPAVPGWNIIDTVNTSFTQRSTYVGGSFAVNGNGIADIQTSVTTFNLLSITGGFRIDTVIPLSESIGVQVRDSDGLVVCQGICTGDGLTGGVVTPTMQVTCSHVGYRKLSGTTYTLYTNNMSSIPLTVADMYLRINNLGPIV